MVATASRTAVAVARHGLWCPVRRRVGVALRVVESDARDLATTPHDESPYRCEDDPDEEEGGKDGFGCEDGLPCLEPLLLECGIYIGESVLLRRLRGHTVTDLLDVSKT